MSGKTNLIWTEEEVTLLLSVVNDIKTQKAAEGSDWRSIKNKYEDLAKNTLKDIQRVQQASFQKVASVRNSLPKKDCAAN